LEDKRIRKYSSFNVFIKSKEKFLTQFISGKCNDGFFMKHEKKEYIDGIFNYCDRWCEKCTFTSNCRLFSNESKIYTYEILSDSKLPDSEEIIKQGLKDFEEIEDVFKDFEFEDELDLYEEEEEEIIASLSKEKKEYEIEKLSKIYSDKAHLFLKSLDNKFILSNADYKKKEEPKIRLVYENFEIVSWYHMFIMVKIKRAIGGKGELKIGMDEFDNEISSYDMNGSSKIAAIGIKESQKALNNLLSLVKEYSSEIEDMLVLLGKILNCINQEFPDYNKFKRPGFDTEN